MSICSWWRGGHNWVIVGKGMKNETWHYYYEGMKIPGSEYVRHKPTLIKKCIKCGELRAYDGFEETPVSIEFAKKKIVALGGIVDDGI